MCGTECIQEPPGCHTFQRSGFLRQDGRRLPAVSFVLRSISPSCNRLAAAQLVLNVRSPYVGGMRRDERSEAMLKMARELARHGHRLPMIEALPGAKGFPGGERFLHQPPNQHKP